MATNSQITASATQATEINIGEAAALSLGLTYTVMGQTVGLLMENAVSNEQRMQMIASTATSVTCALIIQMGSK